MKGRVDGLYMQRWFEEIDGSNSDKIKYIYYSGKSGRM